MTALNEKSKTGKMQVLIVEDRALARAELKYLLSLHPDVEVSAECEDTASAWPLIQSGEFDGVFLDIDIETESHRAGLDLAIRIERADLHKSPWIVFITGFEDFALTAHQIRPFGYLVKPLSDADLTQVLNKIRKYQHQPPQAIKRIIRIRHRKLIRAEVVSCIKYVTSDEILYIQAEKNTDYVRIKLIDGEILEGVNIPLRTWCSDLQELIQIHRSHLVNINLINGLNPDPFRVDGFNATFRGFEDELAVGRTHLQSLVDALEGKCR